MNTERTIHELETWPDKFDLKSWQHDNSVLGREMNSGIGRLIHDVARWHRNFPWREVRIAIDKEDQASFMKYCDEYIKNGVNILDDLIREATHSEARWQRMPDGGDKAAAAAKDIAAAAKGMAQKFRALTSRFWELTRHGQAVTRRMREDADALDVHRQLVQMQHDQREHDQRRSVQFQAGQTQRQLAQMRDARLRQIRAGRRRNEDDS